MDITELLGKTLITIHKMDTTIYFATESGEEYEMYHEQDCCESVYVEDIIGELDDLIGSPITMAEEITNHDENPEGVPKKDYQESWTWTFYKLATVKGYVTIRWYGESNGYYSESVDFRQL